MWESEEHAKAGDAALLEWVQANTTMKVESRFSGNSRGWRSPHAEDLSSSPNYNDRRARGRFVLGKCGRETGGGA